MGRLGGGVQAGLRRIGVGAALFACAACASSGSGVVHVVRPAENLYRISRHYGVATADIARANGIRDVTKLPVGRRLRIPGGRGSQPSYALVPPKEVAAVSARAPAGGGAALAKREAHLAFSWPVRGRLSSRYGWRKGRMHEGIDIPARQGTPVHAAEAGRVIHSGSLGAYGRVVIVKHAGHYSTVYAHNRKNLVRKGAFVERGQVLAEVGHTGNARGAHLHFEVRRSRRPQDPLAYLP